MAGERVLVIEDEQDISELIRFSLEREGFAVSTALTGEKGLALAKAEPFDLIVLDLMLPGINGLDVCRQLKSNSDTAQIPIIMVTARDDEIDVVTGLEVGADDYLGKPFSPKILVARVRALLRRQIEMAESETSLLTVGDLTYDPGKRKVSVSGQPVDLTHTEFELLGVLVRKPGWVFSRSQLIDSLRDGQQVITDRAIDVQVANLRKKLGAAGRLIETVRGTGYRMMEPT